MFESESTQQSESDTKERTYTHTENPIRFGITMKMRRSLVSQHSNERLGVRTLERNVDTFHTIGLSRRVQLSLLVKHGTCLIFQMISHRYCVCSNLSRADTAFYDRKKHLISVFDFTVVYWVMVRVHAFYTCINNERYQCNIHGDDQTYSVTYAFHE